MAPTPRTPASRLTAAGLTVAALTGCMASVPNRLDFSDTEKAKITEIVIGSGYGDVTVRASAVAETTVKRTVRYAGAEPARSYRVDGAVLHLDTDCGHDCSVSYNVEAPTGVAVRGELTSGDVDLTGVATVDVTVSSGAVTVQGATGNVRVTASSGDISVADLAGPARLAVTSGNITGRGLGKGRVDAEADSGDIDLQLTRANSVTARVTSGDAKVLVPEGRYRVRTDVDSGDARVSIPDDPAATLTLDVSASSGDLTVARR